MVAVTRAVTSANSSVILSNIIYVVGAVVLASVVASIVVLHNRRPRSVQSNMDTFHRGLAALAPERPSMSTRAASAQRSARAGERSLQVSTKVVPRSGGAVGRRPRSGSPPG